MDDTDPADLVRLAQAMEKRLKAQDATILALKRQLEVHASTIGRLVDNDLSDSRTAAAGASLLEGLLGLLADRDPDRVRFVADLRDRSIDRLPPDEVEAVRERLEKTLAPLETRRGTGA